MNLPRHGEIAGRLRAARAYSGLTADELAATLGISTTTLSRLENGRGQISTQRMAQVAEACAVPLSFMEHGFIEERPAPEERIEAVEHRLRTHEQQLKAIDTQLGALRDREPLLADLLSPEPSRGERDAAQDEPGGQRPRRGSRRSRRGPDAAPSESA